MSMLCACKQLSHHSCLPSLKSDTTVKVVGVAGAGSEAMAAVATCAPRPEGQGPRGGGQGRCSQPLPGPLMKTQALPVLRGGASGIPAPSLSISITSDRDCRSLKAPTVNWPRFLARTSE